LIGLSTCDNIKIIRGAHQSGLISALSRVLFDARFQEVIVRVEEEISRFTPVRDTLLTIGVFDGVHLGHQFLLSELVTRARERNLLGGVVTFRQHPRDYFFPKNKLSFLMTLSERERVLRKVGVDVVAALSFKSEMAGLTARDFLILLQKYLHMKGLVIGPDTAVGKDREGTVEVIKRLGAEMGFDVNVVAPKQINGEIVSSTLIRKAIADGDITRVTRMLGRPLSLHGKVTSGHHRGTGLGFPTANIVSSARQALPPDGVYVTWAHVGHKRYRSVTNIGLRPTFGNSNRRNVEVFILDYDNDIYGKPLRIELIERLREERKFDSIDALKRQIEDDVRRGREILGKLESKTL
jgi:riboflavin kinase/FMN adenylyltransferase